MQSTQAQGIGELFQAFRQGPRQPLTLLCIAVAYIQQAMTRKVDDRNRTVLQAFAFLQVRALFMIIWMCTCINIWMYMCIMAVDLPSQVCRNLVIPDGLPGILGMSVIAPCLSQCCSVMNGVMTCLSMSWQNQPALLQPT